MPASVSRALDAVDEAVGLLRKQVTGGEVPVGGGEGGDRTPRTGPAKLAEAEAAVALATAMAAAVVARESAKGTELSEEGVDAEREMDKCTRVLERIVALRAQPPGSAKASKKKHAVVALAASSSTPSKKKQR